MQYPYMLVMRNTTQGMIWQAYTVQNDKEVELLTKSAKGNGFHVETQPVGYTEESTPGWRESQEWQDYYAGRLSERAKGQAEVRKALANIQRDGPYWLGGYDDWLVSCFSLRNMADLNDFTPIACWSELISGICTQWLVCTKDGKAYVDCLSSNNYSRGYGLKPEPATEQLYPPHVYDWLFKDVLVNTPV